MRVTVPGVGHPERTFPFTFDGETIEANSGDTVAAALIADGHLDLRETWDGSRRGLFCGMGACHECEVVIDGRPALSCMIGVEDGMVVTRQVAAPVAPRTEGKVFPVPEEVSPSVLVLGGGPAGLSAAATMAEHGLDVVLIDERSKLGGQFYKQPSPDRRIHPQRLDGQYRAGRKLVMRVHQAGVRVIGGAMVWAAFAPDLLMARSDKESWRLRPSSLVLATGACERAVPLPGWTLPGVMTAGAAQTLLRSGQVSPGRRVLLSGAGPLNMQVASELVRAGIEVPALVEQADLRWWRNLESGWRMLLSAPELVGKGFSYRMTLKRAGVPVLDRSSVIKIRGEGKVEAAVVASLDESGTPVRGTEREITTDAVCLGYGFVPANEIARALGCAHRIDPHSGTLVTSRTPTGRTSVESVWVVGDAGGINGAYAAKSLGAIAGADVLADLDVLTDREAVSLTRSERRRLARHLRFQNGLDRLYTAAPLTTRLATDTTLVCRCESVALSDLQGSFNEGPLSAGAAKRLTRAGMGKCQGRYCSPSVVALASEAAGASIDEFSGFAPQTPIRPVTIAEVAGATSE